MPVNVFEIRLDKRAFYLMNRLQEQGEVQFHAARLAQWRTGWPIRWPLNAPATNLLSNLREILLYFGFGVHDPLPSDGTRTTP